MSSKTSVLTSKNIHPYTNFRSSMRAVIRRHAFDMTGLCPDVSCPFDAGRLLRANYAKMLMITLMRADVIEASDQSSVASLYQGAGEEPKGCEGLGDSCKSLKPTLQINAH